MKFVGVDLTSSFARSPRPIDIAVLDSSLNVLFCSVAWPAVEAVVNRDSNLLVRTILAPIPFQAGEQVVLAVDGPQGLAPIGQTARACEKILGTPGRTPDQLPPPREAGIPFQGYIRSSVDLFAALVNATPPHLLAGLHSLSRAEAGLWEVFPGAEWVVLAGQRLARKTTLAGREARRDVLVQLGVTFPTGSLPTADQHDALVGAYLAWCVHHRAEAVEIVGIGPTRNGEIREGFILHASPRMRANLPGIQGPALKVPLPDVDRNRIEQPDPGPGEDWNEDQACLLLLTDYGLVHGTEPENAWLVSGTNYVVETLPPDPRIRLRLDHAPTFSSGRGWCVQPKVKPTLRLLGYQTPDHLDRPNAVTLRVTAV